MLNILIDPSQDRKIVDFRKIGMQDLITLGRYQYSRAHRPLARHTHGDMLEICLLDEGVQPYIVEDDTFVLTGGDALITFPNEKHGTGRSPENRGRLYWLLIRKPDAHERFLNLPTAQGHQLVNTLLSLSPRHFRGTPILKVCLENMFADHEQRTDPFRPAKIKNWGLRFLFEFLRCSREPPPSLTPRIRQILKIIEERTHDEPPQLMELARLAGLSLSRFKARFKEEVGIAPGNYIIQRKIERAKERLKASNTSITLLAFELGFSSSQYFATAFKRYTGITPRQFRNDC